MPYPKTGSTFNGGWKLIHDHFPSFSPLFSPNSQQPWKFSGCVWLQQKEKELVQEETRTNNVSPTVFQ